MIHIAVIDDDPNFCEDLKKQLENIDNSFSVDCYLNTESFIKSVQKYDIAIIDIILKESSGIDNASQILNRFPSIDIIFVSVERDFFQDVYAVKHSYFLVKPVSDSELRKAVDLCLENRKKRYICIKQRSGMIKIDLNKVAYFEGMLKKTIVHYINGSEQILNLPLKETEQKLELTTFIRTHQSYIVNLSRITHASKSKLTILGTEIPVSRKYMSSVTDTLSRYLAKKFL